MIKYDLHDVRIHSIIFDESENDIPSLVFDIDTWEMLSCDNYEAIFSIQPVVLIFNNVYDVGLRFSHPGDPLMMVVDNIFEECNKIFRIEIKLLQQESSINFFTTSWKLINYGDCVKKQGIQYLSRRERPVC